MLEQEQIGKVSMTDVEIEKLFNVIKHGSEEHQEWLKDALFAFFRGEKPPEYKS